MHDWPFGMFEYVCAMCAETCIGMGVAPAAKAVHSREQGLKICGVDDWQAPSSFICMTSDIDRRGF